MKKRTIKIAGIGLAFILAMEPVTAFADNTTVAGAAAILKSDRTAEEYIAIAKEAEGTLWGYTNLGIANVDNNLNIRESADESAKLVGKLPKDSACEIIGTEGNWAHILSGDVEGYVSLDFLFTGVDAKLRAKEIVTTVAVVHADALKIREQPRLDSEVLTYVPDGAQLEYVETEGEWLKILVDDEEAYVSAEFATVEETLGTAVTMTQLLYGQGVSDLRVDLCEFAKQYVGNPYVWGGTSLTKGADCSGFVLSVYKNFGYTLSHSSRAQAGEGTKISINEAKPGDLVFYGNGSGSINHVAIYLGGGQVIHASSPKTGIRISNYDYRTPVKVVKVIKD